MRLAGGWLADVAGAVGVAATEDGPAAVRAAGALPDAASAGWTFSAPEALNTTLKLTPNPNMYSITAPTRKLLDCPCHTATAALDDLPE